MKSYGSDIKAGKKTLMMVYALEHASDEDRAILNNILVNRDASDDDIKLAIDILNRSGAVEYTQDLAEEYADKARELLNVLPESDSKNVLEEFVEFMVKRDF